MNSWNFEHLTLNDLEVTLNLKRKICTKTFSESLGHEDIKKYRRYKLTWIFRKSTQATLL